VEQLVRTLELGDSMALLLLDCTREELAQDLSEHGADLSRSALHRQLCVAPEQAPDDARWSLLVSDLSFGANLTDLQMLATLGAMAGRAGAPLLAAAQPVLLGCSSVAQLADAKAWQVLPAELGAYWAALRQSPVAPWLGLALPRVLLRLPYGKASDPISTFAFEELAAREHQDYLWGSAAWALALLAGQAFMEQAWDMELATGAELDDLPSHVVLVDGEKQLQPCAELLMSEAAGDAVLRHGPMVLLSYRQRNAVRLLRWQSIAEPAQALRGAWE
jgi:type VI secretion system protein ImpC